MGENRAVSYLAVKEGADAGHGAAQVSVHKLLHVSAYSMNGPIYSSKQQLKSISTGDIITTGTRKTMEIKTKIKKSNYETNIIHTK